MLTIIIAYILAALLTVEQAFDCISTNLVISKGRGHEGNGLMAKWMGLAGQWWWSIKLPFVAFAWWAANIVGGEWVTVTIPFSTGTFGFPLIPVLLGALVLLYGYVLWNNYKIAWRHR